MKNLRIVSLVSIFLLFHFQGLCQDSEDSFIDKKELRYGYVSLSVGALKINRSDKELIKRLYGKVSAGMGERWFIGGLSISFNSVMLRTEITSFSYLFSKKEFIEPEVFFVISGNYLFDFPVNIRYDFGIVFGYHHAFTIEYKQEVWNIGVMTTIDFFQDATQPVLGFGLSFSFLSPKKNKQKHSL